MMDGVIQFAEKNGSDADNKHQKMHLELHFHSDFDV